MNAIIRSAADREAVGYRRRWARILPNVFIVYTISYLDRVNVGTALPAISQDLHLSPTEAGFIGGVFFWGYLVSFLEQHITGNSEAGADGSRHDGQEGEKQRTG